MRICTHYIPAAIHSTITIQLAFFSSCSYLVTPSTRCMCCLITWTRKAYAKAYSYQFFNILLLPMYYTYFVILLLFILYLQNQDLARLGHVNQYLPRIRCARTPRTRWRRTSRPVRGRATKHKVESSSVGKNVVPAHPALIPRLAIDLERLNIVNIFTPAGGSDLERFATAQGDGQVSEPGRSDEEGSLARHGIQADHIPQ